MFDFSAGQCPQCWRGNSYTVREGDTFYKISRLYNISMDDLLDANPCLNPESIAPGQVICIPLVIPPANCSAGATTHVVGKGDTFYSIAGRFNISLNSLMNANPNINPDALLVGQSICIPRIWDTFSSSAYGVSFMYPYLWSGVDNERYEGVDGFFQISAIASDSDIEEICNREAHHRLKPYGSHPAISKAVVNGLEACIIIPSPDQPREMHGQSALIIRYGKPVEISGTIYNFLIIWADKEHIKGISNTLEFFE